MIDFVLSFFIYTSGIAILITSLVIHIARHPQSRAWPNSLKHRWMMGALYTGTLFINFVIPYVLLGESFLAVLSLLFLVLLLATWARHLVKMIFSDLQRHMADRRSLFRHRADCAVS